MIEIIVVEPGQRLGAVREIFWEYLQWANQEIVNTYHVSFDISAMLEQDMSDLGKFFRPGGRLIFRTARRRRGWTRLSEIFDGALR